MTRARRNRTGKGKERDCFPEKSSTIVRTYCTYCRRAAVKRDEGLRSIESGRGRRTRYEPPHDTSPAMLVDPRYSIETEHYSFIVSPPAGRVCVCVCFCCPMAHEDFVVCQLWHLQRAFGRHANTHPSTIVRKGIVMLRRITPSSVVISMRFLTLVIVYWY